MQDEDFPSPPGLLNSALVVLIAGSMFLQACRRPAPPGAEVATPAITATAPASPSRAGMVTEPPSPAADPSPPWLHHEHDGSVRFSATVVPDAMLRERFDKLLNAFQGRSLGLCGDCRPAWDERGNELPSAFQDARRELVRSLSDADLHQFVAALLRVRDEDRQDGAGQSELEGVFFTPELQPAGMRVLLADMTAQARRHELGSTYAIAQMALDGPPESVELFREIVRWPCELPLTAGQTWNTWTEKTLAAAALTRLGTAEDLAAAIATVHACADETSTTDWDWETDVGVTKAPQAMEERLRAAPKDPVAWRQWFESSFGSSLASD